MSHGHLFDLCHAELGVVIAARVTHAKGYWQKAVGLIGRTSLDGGLCLNGVGSVHTFGMAFAIDVILLDDGCRIVKLCSNVSPNRVVLKARGASSCVELPAGTLEACSGLAIGDRVVWAHAS